jgi:hypothetical protein
MRRWVEFCSERQSGSSDSRDGPCHGEDGNRTCPGREQGFRGARRGGARGHYVIDQQYTPAANQGGSIAAERGSHIAAPLGIGQANLREGVPHTGERRLRARQHQLLLKSRCQQSRLVETALTPATRMEGNGDDEIERLPPPGFQAGRGKERPKRFCEIPPPLELESLHEPAQLGGIVSEGPGARKRRRLDAARAAEVSVIGQGHLKWQAAQRAPRGIQAQADCPFPTVPANAAVAQAGHRGGAEEAPVREDQVEDTVTGPADARNGQAPVRGQGRLRTHRGKVR